MRFAVAVVLLVACSEDPHEVVDCGTFECEVPCADGVTSGNTDETDSTCTFELDGQQAACDLNTSARIWPVTFDGTQGCCVKPTGAEFRVYEWHACE